MQTQHTYSAQAELCVRQAEHAKTPKHRLILLQMAQTWRRMADDAEANRSAVEVLETAS